MAATVSVWRTFVRTYGARDGGDEWSPYLPLWRNQKLPELASLTDFEFWPQKGLKYLGHLYQDNIFRSFEDLKQTLGLPRSALYWYFQLRHACFAQFGYKELRLGCGPIESIARQVNLSKPVSTFYRSILICQPSPLEKSFQRWQRDIPQLVTCHFKELGSRWRSTVVSARDQYTN